ncbi:glycosyltransferase [Lachnoanaerobaculum umeaense]|uniref:Glycosyltransferase family 2 protein n=1 Tax=Lachnoanaerobaculum umeaense TaxID=617123 RepID=A0A385PXR3_9FIRM|nr:glycosyltransferase family 2 protein [Lachnoanaerobaculum umeaense]AYA98705.1 glycosyltransferase family 2 protein [Lachnoanaerobaculum umeaense]PZW99945.1 GT2 family glycosyltransferase [Lachnoanaerobaculum umeaense]
MKLALVVLNYNDADNTLKILGNVADYSVFDKVIVVDNASNDDSKIRLKSFCEKRDKIFFVENQENKGYGAGNNVGIFVAKKLGMDLALIANPDTDFEERVIKVVKSVMVKNYNISICAPLVETNDVYGSRENVLKGASCWPMRDFMHSLVENGPICRRLFTKALHYDRNFYNAKIRKVGAVLGALLMVRVEDFLRVSGYDENMFLYGEEDLLSKKMADIGKKTVVVTGYKYKHIHSASIKKSLKSLYSRQKIREESTMYFYKNYLKINLLQQIFAKVFFAFVRLEVIIFGLM